MPSDCMKAGSTWLPTCMDRYWVRRSEVLRLYWIVMPSSPFPTTWVYWARKWRSLWRTENQGTGNVERLVISPPPAQRRSLWSSGPKRPKSSSRWVCRAGDRYTSDWNRRGQIYGWVPFTTHIPRKPLARRLDGCGECEWLVYGRVRRMHLTVGPQ